MKRIIIFSTIIISLASCQKKHNYECKIYTVQNINGSEPHYFSTKSKSDKFIREYTIKNDSGDTTTIVKCTKK